MNDRYRSPKNLTETSMLSSKTPFHFKTLLQKNWVEKKLGWKVSCCKDWHAVEQNANHPSKTKNWHAVEQNASFVNLHRARKLILNDRYRSPKNLNETSMLSSKTPFHFKTLLQKNWVEKKLGWKVSCCKDWHAVEQNANHPSKTKNWHAVEQNASFVNLHRARKLILNDRYRSPKNLTETSMLSTKTPFHFKILLQ